MEDNKFDEYFSDDYFFFGGSAMSQVIESGPMFGRPFGGVMIMIKKEPRKITESIYCSDRFSLVKIANYLVANVYLPCVGTPGRSLIIEDLLGDLSSWRDKYVNCDFIVAGDFNVDLDSGDKISSVLN